MLVSIENDLISLTVDTLGAQMMSLVSGEGLEYLWQGDPQYWPDSAPILFPMVARLYQQKHIARGRECPMGIHGFAWKSEFFLEERSAERMALRLESSPATLAQYPYPFSLQVSYRLKAATVEITYRVCNPGRETMHFAIGGHPGFRVPLRSGERFEDYRLVFSKACRPERLLFSQQLLLEGGSAPYPLEGEQVLPLSHGLFDEDAVILQKADRAVSLCRGNTPQLTLSFPDMPYLGLWHCPKTRAPYLCIEPWSSLPGRQDVVEALSAREDMIHLEAGGLYENTWSITIGQG